MRFAALILSFVLHAVFLTWLFLHKPDISPIIAEPETQIELTPQTNPAPSNAPSKSAEKNPETAASSNSDSTSSAITDKTISSTDAHNTHTHTETGVATKPAQSNSASISTASTTSNSSTASNSVSKSSNTSTSASANSSTPTSSSITNAPAASLAPKRNRPITTELKCSPTADAQNVRGQVSVNVQINKFGQVKSSSIIAGKGNIINELALSQAKLLHFPVMRNADNVDIESFSDVLFTFDCSRN